MPTAVKMQREFGEDLHTVFVESQGHSNEEIARLALKKQWFGTSAMWTTERPMNTNAPGIPNFVLLSSEGEVVLMGNPIAMHGQIEDYLAANAKRRAPDDLPKELAGAWKSLQKGQFADAIAEVEKAAAASNASEAVQQTASGLIEQITARATSQVERLERMIEDGLYSVAEDQFAKLPDALASMELATRANDALARLESPELADEIKAEKAWNKLEAKLFAKGVEKGTARQLGKFVEKHSGTKAAERAQFYVRAIGDDAE